LYYRLDCIYELLIRFEKKKLEWLSFSDCVTCDLLWENRLLWQFIDKYWK